MWRGPGDSRRGVDGGPGRGSVRRRWCRHGGGRGEGVQVVGK
jgi:hypothetical protein